MNKKGLVQLIGFVSIVVFFVCGQQALAQDARDHWQVRVLPTNHAVKPIDRTAFGMYFISEGFATLPPTDGNGDDEWPCLPNVGTNSADCSSIASGGLVIGDPTYNWLLSDCDPSTAASCGQVYLFYEDGTGSTADIITRITAKQGTYMLLDTGDVNQGPNSAPVGSTVVLSYDTAFGTQGSGSAKGHGYCEGTKTVCHDPVDGSVTVSVTVTIGPSKVMKSFVINLYTPLGG